MFFKHYSIQQLAFLGFLLVFLDFFKVQKCFVDCRAKFYSSAVFFVEWWFLSLQDPNILVFFLIFRCLFELDLLL